MSGKEVSTSNRPFLNMDDNELADLASYGDDAQKQALKILAGGVQFDSARNIYLDKSGQIDVTGNYQTLQQLRNKRTDKAKNREEYLKAVSENPGRDATVLFGGAKGKNTLGL